jgi:hypothetical protein
MIARPLLLVHSYIITTMKRKDGNRREKVQRLRDFRTHYENEKTRAARKAPTA